MKILILSQHFWPETFRINQVATDLARTGCEVTVLTGKPNYPSGVVFEGYKATGIARETYEGIDVHRVPLVPRGRGGAVGLAWNYLSFLSVASVLGPWMLRGRKFDVVFVYGTSPILQAIPAVIIKWIKHSPLVVWVQDLWPDSLQATGFVKSPLLLRWVALAVRWIYRRADLLLVQSEAFVRPVRTMAGDTPVEYHPNPGETPLAQQATAQESQDVPLASGCFNVVFTGNIGTAQGLERVLDAAQELVADADIRFVLVGAGSRLEALRQEVQRRKLTNVSLPGHFPASAMPSLMARASALLVSLTAEPIFSQTVPSKVQSYLASGRPIIAFLDGEGARIVQEAGAGVACPAGDHRGLVRAVLDLRARTGAQRAAMGEAGRRFYVQHFEPDALAQRLAARFARLRALG